MIALAAMMAAQMRRNIDMTHGLVMSEAVNNLGQAGVMVDRVLGALRP